MWEVGRCEEGKEQESGKGREKRKTEARKEAGGGLGR